MRRPWNMINVPIYSLATYVDGEVNMNICSYVTAVSRKPKQYLVALEHGTKTLQNILRSEYAVLQLLQSDAQDLIKWLGMRSGHQVNKMERLEKNNRITSWKKYAVLKDAAAYLELRKLKSVDTAGDHSMLFFDVSRSRSITDNNILMWQDLIDNKIILN